MHLIEIGLGIFFVFFVLLWPEPPNVVKWVGLIVGVGLVAWGLARYTAVGQRLWARTQQFQWIPPRLQARVPTGLRSLAGLILLSASILVAAGLAFLVVDQLWHKDESAETTVPPTTALRSLSAPAQAKMLALIGERLPEPRGVTLVTLSGQSSMLLAETLASVFHEAGWNVTPLEDYYFAMSVVGVHIKGTDQHLIDELSDIFKLVGISDAVARYDGDEDGSVEITIGYVAKEPSR